MSAFRASACLLKTRNEYVNEEMIEERIIGQGLVNTSLERTRQHCSSGASFLYILKLKNILYLIYLLVKHIVQVMTDDRQI